MHLPHDEFWFTLHAGTALNLIAQYLDEDIIKRKNETAMQELQIAILSTCGGRGLGVAAPGRGTYVGKDNIPEGW